MERQPRVILAGREVAPLRVMAHAIENIGAEVEITHSHKALVRRCSRRHYSLVITRFVTPLINSPKEVQRLRGPQRATRLFVLSHTHNSNIVITLLDRGVNQFLSLPVHSPRLARKVKDELYKFHTLCQP